MSEFNYKDKSAPKLTDEFKQEFVVKIQNRVDTIKVDGLIAFANEKGIKSMKTEIIQFPSQDNQWTCIAQTTVIGYDWNPATDKIEEVIYSDFADANPGNCTKLTSSAYIRMASTRSIGRTLRKYTNINMVTAEEINTSIDNHEPEISQQALESVKMLLYQKHLNQNDFTKIMMDTFQHINYMGLKQSEANKLISILQAQPVKSLEPQAPKSEQVEKSTPAQG